MPSAESPVPTGLPDTDLFTIESVPSKGKGLIASKPIPAGTLLISEPPLFTTASLTNADTIEKDLGVIVRSLPKEGQRAFLSLHNNFPGQPNPFSNIIRSNGYPLGPNSEVGGIFPLIARLNHSCLPNAQHSWNEKLQRQTVYAVRDVAAGAELTLSYHNGGPSTERKAALKQFFGFDCACELCSLPPEKLRKSDKRLRDAAMLDEMIGDSKRVQLQPADALKDCKELLRIYEKEGIKDKRLPRLYYDAFQICALHSDAARASVFAESARRARELCEGPESEEAASMKELQEAPEKFENWGSTEKWASKVADRETRYKDIECPVTVKTASVWDA
ncbi:putative SET domain-containing protein [Seiridium unicorne]|uniref:SET domain-containing protein n=1 Tax=Seiridium unicorne TaxID=138068 RepID=A0ABR2VIF6_9PEZI